MASFRFDKVGQAVNVEFFPEVSDVNVENIAASSLVVLIGMLGEVFPGKDLSFFEHEAFEELVFPFGEGDVVSISLDSFESGVDFEIAGSQDWGGGSVFAANLNFDPGDQLFESEGFDEIVVGTGFEALDSLFDGVARADEDDRGGDFPGTDFF